MHIIIDNQIRIYFDHYKEYKDLLVWDSIVNDMDLRFNYNDKFWYTYTTDTNLEYMLNNNTFIITPITVKLDDPRIQSIVNKHQLRAQSIVLSRLTSKEFVKYCKSIPPNTIDTELDDFLLDFQKESVLKSVYNLIHFNGSIIAHATGLGKTVQSISISKICKELLGITHIVFITLNSVISGYTDEINKFAPELNPYMINNGVKSYKNGKKKMYTFLEFLDIHKCIVTNYENIIAMYNRDMFFSEFKNNNVLLVFDEASKLKNDKTKTYSIYTDIINKLRQDNNVYLLLMTGTPYENDLKDFYNLLKFCINTKFNDKEFYKMFVVSDYRYYYGKKQYMPVGNKNMLMFNKTFSQFYTRKSLKDVSDQLPEKTELNRFIEVDKTQQKLMNMLEVIFDMYVMEKNLGWLDKKDLRKMVTSLYRIIASDPIALKSSDSTILKFAKETNPELDMVKLIPNNYKSNKLKELIELLHEIDINNNKVLIFTQWTSVQDVIYKEIVKVFGIEPYRIYGEVSSKDRGEILKQFNSNNEVNVLIGTDAMAYGVNLPDVDYLIEYDIPWNPSKRIQRTNRIYRLSSQRKKVIIDLINEYEQPVFEVMNRKIQGFQISVDGEDIESIDYNSVELDEKHTLLKKLLRR